MKSKCSVCFASSKSSPEILPSTLYYIEYFFPYLAACTKHQYKISLNIFIR